MVSSGSAESQSTFESKGVPELDDEELEVDDEPVELELELPPEVDGGGSSPQPGAEATMARPPKARNQKCFALIRFFSSHE
jgi:hypothetical protein